jgi:hypothetical protein
LANSTALLASGFNRNHATTDEGGVIPEEFRVEYVVDRVKTTGNVWMGLTMECAQCHDHKYDPISQEEYFKFYAFYNNNADPQTQTRRGNTAPTVEVVTPERKKQLSEASKAVELANASLQSRRKESLKSFDQWTHKTKNQLKENPQTHLCLIRGVKRLHVEDLSSIAQCLGEEASWSSEEEIEPTTFRRSLWLIDEKDPLTHVCTLESAGKTCRSTSHNNEVIRLHQL